MPSATAGRVWLELADPEPHHVVEVDTDVSVAETELPTAGSVVAAVDQGLVLQHEDRLTVWNPRSGRTVATLPGHHLLGAHGDLLVSCPAGCATATLTQLDSGERRRLPAPEGASFIGYAGRVSPDGRRLAAPTHRRGAEAGDRRGLAVIDLTTGAVVHALVEHVGRSDPRWSPDSRSVLVSLDDDRLALYRHGDPMARVVPIHLGDFLGIAVGPAA